MNIETYLSEILKESFEKLGYNSTLAKAVVSTREGVGHFQCNAAMPLAKFAKKAPNIIAQEIIDNIEDKDIFLEMVVANPGFINMTLAPEFLAKLSTSFNKANKFGYSKDMQPKKIVLDFGGPNVAKPMHVGHIRSTLIGDCLQRLYKFCGDEVVSDVHLGDWGTQMGMLIEEIKLKSPDLIYFNESYDGEYPKDSPVTVSELAEIYPKASKRCKSDKDEMEKARQATYELQQGRKGYRALWQHFVDVSVQAVKNDFAGLGVTFDLWLGESDSNKYVSEVVSFLKNKGLIYEDDGAWIVDTGQEDIPPLIVIKSDGAIMYGTTDLATLWQRQKDFNPDKIVYVVDKRQSLHFKQVFAVAKRAGIVNEGCELKHVAFGTVNGKDGKPFKTREGGVMHLKDLIEQAKSRARERMQDENYDEALVNQIAMATIKFGDLVNTYTSDYVFDLDKFSKYEGKTGPYLLYTAVRVKSIIRKLFGESFDLNALVNNFDILSATNEHEEKLQLQLIQFPLAVARTYEKSEPHHLCEYAYSLANTFSKFYVNCPILAEEDEEIKSSRIAMSVATLKAMTLTLNMLGISIPEKM
ncbi:arginine--tRNA ligase [Francisella frigiditurris]|uniref:Arginine--tRNA ligase n=1 Tax=Francisella frigiditurris TaxID=1542390 RepID=A0A1J0KSA5_9GAMM|nr:arginine--tRNA ligase [Francisella frigiditurris]APC96661.1 arginine--tRNA ligase [Francisella frigiditurris]